MRRLIFVGVISVPCASLSWVIPVWSKWTLSLVRTIVGAVSYAKICCVSCNLSPHQQSFTADAVSDATCISQTASVAEMQPTVELDVRDVLKRFLSYMLDARWFPERKYDEERRIKSSLRTLRRIIKRMEDFAHNHSVEVGPEWKSYESALTQLATNAVRRAPQMDASCLWRGDTAVTERLLCATLIVPELWPDEGVYSTIQRFLAEPSTLPHLVTLAEDAAKELWTPDGWRVFTPLQIHFRRKGEEMPLRPYHISEKGLQSKVARLRNKLSADPQRLRWVVERLYAEYVGTQFSRMGFSDCEAQMLSSLIPPK
jgi:hypothetical protein